MAAVQNHCIAAVDRLPYPCQDGQKGNPGILACVIYWQAKEISRVVRGCKSEDGKIDIALLDHVSPIEWDNVILYGQYLLDRTQVR